MKNLLSVLVISMLWFGVLISCTAQSQESNKMVEVYEDPSDVGEIQTPSLFSRVEVDSSSIGFYLRELSFKEDNKVYLYDGSLKGHQQAQYAVLDIDVGTKDLQQCADATMRLRAEYQFKTGQYDKIAFHFTSGHLASWTKYAEGYRPKISGSNVTWHKTRSLDT